MKGHRIDGSPCAYKHGHGYDSPTYRSWKNMRVRCTWPKYKQACDYSERGITCCDEWKDFRNFLADMGERPENLTLERIDNDGPYCKNNCIWASRTEQNNNSRNVHWIDVLGLRMTFRDACKLFDRSEPNMRRKMKRMSFFEAL